MAEVGGSETAVCTADGLSRSRRSMADSAKDACSRRLFTWRNLAMVHY